MTVFPFHFPIPASAFAKPAANVVLAWHFLQADGTVPRLNVKAEPGLTLTHDGPLTLCQSGLHASENPLDALTYAQSFIVSRVECSGEIVRGNNKLVCASRKVLWVVDAKHQIIEFACWCAERALTARKNAGKPTDPRSWKAIEVTRAWLLGNATIKDVRAARNAAYAAAAYAADADAYAAYAYAAYAAAAYAADAADADAYAAAAEQNERLAQSKHLEALLLSLQPEKEKIT